MADKKISQLTGGGAAQATDEYVIARSGSNFKVTGADVAAAATSVGTLSELNLSGRILLSGSPAGAGSANRYLSSGGTTNSWYFNVPTGGNYYFAAGENTRWRIDSSGHFITGADNTYDIGASGASRPRDLFVARNATVSGSISIPSGNILYLSGPGGGEYLQVSSGTLFLGTAGSGRVRIDASGNVGINTAPLTRLHIKGTGASSGVKFTLSNGGEISAFNDPLGVIDFYSDDTSSGASGIKGYLGVYNQFNGNWDGSPLRHLTYMAFATSLDSVVAERMRIDANGNLGLGVVPGSWGTTWKAFQFGASGSLANNGGNSSFTLASNARNNGSNWIYLNSDAAAAYSHSAGVHSWSVAPSGTAGNAITFTQAMTLDEGGRLAIGNTAAASIDTANAAGNLVVGAGGGSEGITIYTGNASTGSLYFADGTTGAATYAGGVEYTHNTNTLGFRTDGGLRWRIDNSGNFIAVADGTYDIGSSGANRVRNLYALNEVRAQYLSSTSSAGTLRAYWLANATDVMALGKSSGGLGGSLELTEDTAPAAPAANRVRIYAEDNGSGKTRLMALFATGAAVQIAIEP